MDGRVRKRMNGCVASAARTINILNEATSFVRRDVENLSKPVGVCG
jgi:hypothetical protein